MSTEISHEKYISRLSDEDIKHYTFLEKYNKMHDKIKIRHNDCGNIYYVTPNHFLRGKRCPKCQALKKGLHKKIYPEDYAKKIEEKTNGEFILLSEYTGSKNKIRYKHTICGFEHEISAYKLLANTSCKKCNKCIMNKTTDYFKREIYDLVADEYVVLGEYMGARNKTIFIHNVCNLEFKMSPDGFLRGNRCPHCNSSKGEIKIRDFLMSNNITFAKEYTFPDLMSDLNRCLRFDFAIFQYDNPTKLKCLIEYDGEFHYRKCYENDGHDRIIYHDELKNEYCKNNNISLLRIPYKEFDNIENILCNYLKTDNKFIDREEN